MDVLGYGFSGWLLLTSMAAGLGIPLGIPPGDADPMMERIAPQQCLFYMTWAGTTEPKADSQNSTERLLAHPEVRKSLAQVEQSVRSRLVETAKRRDPELVPVVNDIIDWSELALRQPGAAFITDVRLERWGLYADAGLVINLGQRADEIHKALLKYQNQYYPQDQRTVQAGNQTWYQVQLMKDSPVITWGVAGNYLIAGIGQNTVDQILARSQTEPPQWLTAAMQRVPVERRASFAFVNVRGIRETIRQMGGGQTDETIAAVGLDRVQAVLSSTGLGPEGFVARTLVVTEGQPTGLVRLAAGNPLTLEDLQPIPRDAILGLAARLDAPTAWDAFARLMRQRDPANETGLLARLQQFENRTGINIRNDLLASLGNVLTVYAQPDPQREDAIFPYVAAVVSVRDAQRLGALQQRLVNYLQSGEVKILGFPVLVNTREVNNQTVHSLSIAAGLSPVAPAWLLTERQLIVSLSQEGLTSYLNRGPQHQSIAQAPVIAEAFREGQAPVMLAYRDPARGLGLLAPLLQRAPNLAQQLRERTGIEVNLNQAQLPAVVKQLSELGVVAENVKPTLVVVRTAQEGIAIETRSTIPGGNPASVAPAALAASLPVIRTTRAMALRQQSENNLQAVAAAVLNYQKIHNRLPAPHIADAQGNPHLSWRVAILPHLGQDDLYKRFRLNEPWDSEHNRQLIPLMPQSLRSPLSERPAGWTNYLAVRGENALFPAEGPVNTSLIEDKPATTAMLVEANDEKAVPWTKPEDFSPGKQQPAEGLLGLQMNGFLMALADGHVRFVAQGTTPEAIRAFYTRNGQEPILEPVEKVATPNGEGVRR